MTASLPDRVLLAAIEISVVLTVGAGAALLLGVTGTLLVFTLMAHSWSLGLFALLLFSCTTWLELALWRWYPRWHWLLAIELGAAGAFLIWLSNQPFNILEKV